MSTEAARTTAKYKMELFTTSLNLPHRKYHPRLHQSLRYPQMFLKDMLKLL